jgi:hypothetical protein
MTQIRTYSGATLMDVQRLVEAMEEQLLDDMDRTGDSVCMAAKAQAIVAFEPFKEPCETYENFMTLAEAQAVLKQADR